MKLKKEDYINILFLILIFLLIVLLLTRFNYIYGSTVDFSSQHSVIPEYFRTLFYKTKEIFPNFAFNIGAGENIYNLSYYGLLNPFILISYLLPNIEMILYIQITSILIVIISIILMYYFLRSKFNSKYSFIGTLLFLFATPIIYHSHRHIMFINYMPFLIMALMGIDKYLKDNKKILLIISVFLIIMTSYYYSVGSILSICLYWLYKYISINKNINIKKLIYDALKLISVIFIPILMSSILIIPTFYALMNGRSDITSTFNIIDIIKPTIDLNEILYSGYSLGFTSIFILAICYSLFNKKDKLLSITFLLIIIFPFVIYALSGFMYYRGKVLIPFIPIAVLMITNTFYELKHSNSFILCYSVFTIIQIMYFIFNNEPLIAIEPLILFIIYLLSNKLHNKNILIYYVCTISFICSLIVNISDPLVKIDELGKYLNTNDYDNISLIIENDSNLYRMGNYLGDINTINMVTNINNYLPSIYSSLENKYYNYFVNNSIGNEMSNRISTAIFPTSNILFNIYMGMKYLISDSNVPIGYKKVSDNIYINDNVYPIGYSSNNIMSKSYYDALSYPHNIYALMSNIVVDNDIESEFESKIVQEYIDYDVLSKNVSIDSINNHYIINSSDNGYIDIDLNSNYKNKLIFISFNMNYSEICSFADDTSITINGVTNTLSCDNWIYYNNNTNFNYVISSNDDINRLNIKFTKGKYDISNIEIYSLDYNYILSNLNNIDEFIINKDKTIGDYIEGDIKVKNDGYFKLSIPYDNGFEIYLDDNPISYEQVDQAFIGFKIDKGSHNIKIKYTSPYFNLGKICSIIGVFILAIVIFKEKYAHLHK